MKLLIVDDEEKIRTVIKEYAKLEKYDVLEAKDGKEAVSLLKSCHFDLIILDVMMPEMDGFTFLEEQKKRPPVIVLSARREEVDKLTGFDLGIDDYMTKPFSPKELMARCRAVLARCNPLGDSYNYHDLCVNFKSHRVTIKQQEIALTPKEFDLLYYFIKHKGIALSREQLLTDIWDFTFYGDDRTIDTHIKMLRNHLGSYRHLIQTVRGMGYKFYDEEE